MTSFSTRELWPFDLWPWPLVFYKVYPRHITCKNFRLILHREDGEKLLTHWLTDWLTHSLTNKVTSMGEGCHPKIIKLNGIDGTASVQQLHTRLSNWLTATLMPITVDIDGTASVQQWHIRNGIGNSSTCSFLASRFKQPKFLNIVKIQVLVS